MTLANTTRPRRKALVRLLILMATAAVLAAPLAGQDDDHNREPVDLQAIYRIKEEGLQRSKVMDIASYLTDVHGPRLTGSPNIRAAAEWAVKEMQAWGLANATLATWGSFGRGWTNDRYVGHIMTPSRSPIIGYPKAWTPGTNGPRRERGRTSGARERRRPGITTRQAQRQVRPDRARTRRVGACRAAGEALFGQRSRGTRQTAGRTASGGWRSQHLQSGVPAQADGLSRERRRGGDARTRARRWRHGVRAGRRIAQCAGSALGAARSSWRSSTTTGSCASWTGRFR